MQMAMYRLILVIFMIAMRWRDCRSEEPQSKSVNLSDILVKAAGVYKNQTVPGMNRTVVVTASNYGYLNHLLNFKCFMDRLNFRFLVIAMDDKIYDTLLAQHPDIVSYPMFEGVFGKTSSESSNFRSKEFNTMSYRKFEAVAQVLQLGYDVLFTDNDIAIVKDPFPYLLWDNIDHVHSVNIFCHEDTHHFDFYKDDVEGNTGFYFLRSNTNTISLLERALEHFKKYDSMNLDDQTLFWKLMKTIKEPPILPLGECEHFDGEQRKTEVNGKAVSYLVSCPLSPCQFSAGSLAHFDEFRAEMQKRHEEYVTVHANFFVGNPSKKKAMEDHGFWLLDDVTLNTTSHEVQCKVYKPPF